MAAPPEEVRLATGPLVAQEAEAADKQAKQVKDLATKCFLKKLEGKQFGKQEAVAEGVGYMELDTGFLNKEAERSEELRRAGHIVQQLGQEEPSETATSGTAPWCRTVQPVIPRYNNVLDAGIWTWDGPNAWQTIAYSLCQFATHLSSEFLPPYMPSPAEVADTMIFAANVRTVMADSLGTPATDSSDQDYLMFTKIVRMARAVHQLQRLVGQPLAEAARLSRIEKTPGQMISVIGNDGAGGAPPHEYRTQRVTETTDLLVGLGGQRSDFMTRNLALTNVVSALRLADSLSIERLLQEAFGHIGDIFQRLVETGEELLQLPVKLYIKSDGIVLFSRFGTVLPAIQGKEGLVRTIVGYVKYRYYETRVRDPWLLRRALKLPSSPTTSASATSGCPTSPTPRTTRPCTPSSAARSSPRRTACGCGAPWSPSLSTSPSGGATASSTTPGQRGSGRGPSLPTAKCSTVQHYSRWTACGRCTTTRTASSRTSCCAAGTRAR